MDTKQISSVAGEPQQETDSAIPIRMEPVAAVYPENDGTYILSRCSKFRLDFEQGFLAPGAEVSIGFSALNNQLYKTFPLHLYVYVNGLCTEIVALEREFDHAVTRFRVERPGILYISVQLRNRVQPPGSGDVRLPALRLVEVMAKHVAENAAPTTAPYVPASGLQSAYGQENFFNSDTPSADPIFIIGSPRSGTSILTWAIGAHPNIYPIEETNFFPLLTSSAWANYHHASRAAKGLINSYDINRSAFMQAHGAMMHSLIMKTADAQHRFNSHVKVAGASYTNDVVFTLSRAPEDSKSRWVDGAPVNTGVSYLLSMMYPNAKFIHIVRHPAKVIASLMNFDRIGGDALTYEAALDEWFSQVRKGRLLEIALGPDRVLALHFEQLIEAPAEHMRTIFRFLGEPHYETAKDIFRAHMNSSNVDLESLEDVRRQLSNDARWPQLLSLFNGIISSDPSAATAELINLLNDIGCKLLKTTFGYQTDSVF